MDFRPQGRDFFTRERQVRKQNLLRLIRIHQDLPERKLMGIFSLQTGLTFKKIGVYLEELSDAGVIELVDGCWRVTGGGE